MPIADDMTPMPDRTSTAQVLVVTATVGSGHNSVARAIIAALHNRAPQVRVECVDALTFAPKLFRLQYAGGFALGMTRAPRTYGLAFRLTNRPHGPHRGLFERVRLRYERYVLRRFRQFLSANRFDLIVHTHFLSPPQVAHFAGSGMFHTPQWVAVTDIETHRFWYSEGVEQWFVPVDYTAGLLRRWGIPAERITVSGMPIHPKWHEPVDRERVLADWRLPRDRRIVLLSGGTEFTCGPIVKIARRIVSECRDAYVVVLAGRNKKLLARLASMPESPERLLGVSFTDRVHELVEVCSLMVTKAGGITTAECLAKGTPMVLMKPVPGHEAGNARYLAERGVARIAERAGRAPEEVCRLLANASELARLSEGARSLSRDGASLIAEAICRRIGQ